MWDLPGPGIECISLALAGGFLTAGPPEKSVCGFFDNSHFDWCEVIYFMWLGFLYFEGGKTSTSFSLLFYS